ncbi:MAG: hypothetical protein EPO32_14765 [Anaerolineae bacterium]|nr:MAG: hypothetical protein EPO32_14765 [Anaerolineae bacterium]
MRSSITNHPGRASSVPRNHASGSAISFVGCTPLVASLPAGARYPTIAGALRYSVALRIGR